MLYGVCRKFEMERQTRADVIKLRPHHISCIPFLTFDGENLDREFFQLLTKVKHQLISEPDLVITAIEGVDVICRACPSCVDGECDSSLLKEEQVRRLDALLLWELGRSYGDTLSVAQWQSVVSSKWPYRICPICRWKSYCGAQVT